MFRLGCLPNAAAGREEAYEENSSGSAGIGLTISECLARSGWDIAILTRDKKRLDQARGSL